MLGFSFVLYVAQQPHGLRHGLSASILSDVSQDFHQLAMVVHACNLSTGQLAEAGDHQQVSLSYTSFLFCWYVVRFWFWFGGRVSLCSPDWPGTHRDARVSATRVLGLKACTAIPCSVVYCKGSLLEGKEINTELVSAICLFLTGPG